jgi:CRP-like cAMP-binding protein
MQAESSSPEAFLAETDLTRELNPEQVQALARASAVEHFEAGETIVRQGEVYETLKVIVRGGVDVVYTDQGSDESHSVAALGPGDHFGEMAFLSDEAATASVLTTAPTTVLVLSRERARECGVYQALLGRLAALQLGRLEASNRRQVVAMQQTIDAQREQNAFGRFYIATIVLFAVSTAVPNYDHESPWVQLWLRWFFLLLILVPAVVAVRAHAFSLASFGLTTRGWARSAREGLLVATVLVPVMVLFKMASAPAEAELLSWRTLDFYTRGQLVLYAITYVPHAAIQELIARGIGQGSLERFMAGSHPMKPVVIASGLFAILHLHMSVQAAALTFIVSLVFGYLYYRHQSLVGVTVLHVALGLAGTALGLI